MDDSYKAYQELKADFKKENSKWVIKSNYKIFLYWIFLLILLIPQIVLFFTKRTYEYVQDLDDLPSPIQTPATWWTTMRVHWVDVSIDFLAKYDISWKIISLRDYAWTDIEKGLWPRDFVIWRWKMWIQENIDKFRRNDMKNRFIYAYLPEENISRFNEEFSWDFRNDNRWTCRTSFSNNHLIPANRKIKVLMKKIKEWDFVRLQWYLVYAKWSTRSGNYRWGPSSLVRDDWWDHSCEIMYVTDIVRLKEKVED